MSGAAVDDVEEQDQIVATPPANRMAIAVLALAGVLMSVYLMLFKLGMIGELACGVSGGCHEVQTSRYAVFAGLPVPAWGIAGYVALLAAALAGLQPGWVDDRRAAAALLVLSSVGFGFSMYLTALEAFVIHAWCRWCIASAVVATLIFLLALPEIRRLKQV